MIHHDTRLHSDCCFGICVFFEVFSLGIFWFLDVGLALAKLLTEYPDWESCLACLFARLGEKTWNLLGFWNSVVFCWLHWAAFMGI